MKKEIQPNQLLMAVQAMCGAADMIRTCNGTPLEELANKMAVKIAEYSMSVLDQEEGEK